jgi:hypothetical protein
VSVDFNMVLATDYDGDSPGAFANVVGCLGLGQIGNVSGNFLNSMKSQGLINSEAYSIWFDDSPSSK